MGYRVVVDYDRCSSTGICMQLAPEVFEVRDDNFLYLLEEEPPDDIKAKVEAAVKGCPTQALSIEEI